MMKKKVGKSERIRANNWFNFWFLFIFVLLFIGAVLDVDPQSVSDKAKKDDGRPIEEATWNDEECLKEIHEKYGK